MEICPILGVNILVTDMDRTVQFVEENIHKLSGEYVCVSNGHTTVTAYEDASYRNVQNSAVMAFPDGEPLSIVSRKRGFKDARRVTGPDFMEQMFIKGSKGDGLRHFFYGGSQDTLDTLQEILKEKYPGLQIAGMYSPPYRPLSEEEDAQAIRMINESKPDIVWVGLGAPKQERWMYDHRGKVQGLMFGVGAGFDYHAGKLKRAPVWMQKMSLEWLVRLLQDPGRLWKRYLVTNVKFLWYVRKENKRYKKLI
ncbi:MAG: WecB/TagA/CpsF family glycosyltransferase [Lachnospiraceae bacterium]|nr:WecB/TagA/CpsF family glycosyltransferase [Lachnospiraceae bacterium]